jgi:hypothetical protein
MIDPNDQVLALVEDMRKAVVRFEAGDLSIHRLSWDLKSRVAALDGIADLQWVEQLRTMRNEIELINAVSIESGRSALTDTERREACDILKGLKVALEAHRLTDP